MNKMKKILLYGLFCPVGLGLSFVFMLWMERWLGLVSFSILVLSFLFLPLYKKPMVLAVSWLVFIFSLAVPFDISMRDLPGPPRFVPYSKGLPKQYMHEKARRGEVILGGCVIKGNEPLWYWVW